MAKGTSKNRLLAINNYFYRRGGAEVIFLEHMSLFEAAGWDVAPFSMHHPLNLESPWSLYFVNEIEYGRQPSLGVKVRDAARVVYSREAQRKLMAMLSKFRPTVAHAHNVYHHLSPSIFKTLRSAGIPTVMTAHDLKIACPAKTMLSHGKLCEKCKSGNIVHVLTNRCVKDSFAVSGLVLVESAVHRALGLYRNYLDRIVTPSRFYREKLIEWGWPPQQIVYIPNFVETANVSADQISEGDYFVYAGRLSEEKGIPTLIKAAGLAGHRLVVAGIGPDELALKQLAASQGTKIDFVGYLSGSPLRKLIAGAKALVLPSEWYENAPVSVLEAYALGTPVIGAAIGGIPELIKEKETGLLAASANVEDLARALSEMDGFGSSARAQMGAAARDWMMKEFSPQAYRDRIADLYGRLVTA